MTSLFEYSLMNTRIALRYILFLNLTTAICVFPGCIQTRPIFLREDH